MFITTDLKNVLPRFIYCILVFMEEELNNHSDIVKEDIVNLNLCVNCKKNKFEEGYATRICSECREHLVKFPIPKWIWIFATCVIVLMVIGMIRMPKYFGAAYHLSKAENAIENHAFHTAQKELTLILDDIPDNVDVNGNLFITAAYNNNYPLAIYAYQKLEGKEIKDNDLLARIELAMKLVESNFPIDTTIYSKIALAKDSVEDLKQIYNYMVVKDNLDQNIVGVLIASRLYDLEFYKDAEQILEKILLKNPNFYSAITLMSSVKRNQGMYDRAIDYCDQLLELNSEDVIAFAQKAKIEIKRKDDFKAALYISKALAIDSVNISALEAKFLLNLCLNKKDESMKLFHNIQKMEVGGDTSVTERLRAYNNGNKNYR